MSVWLLTALISYLLGSIPFGYVLVRLVRHEDIRAFGSGNIGATNVARGGGKALGIATLVLDCLKGALAVLLAFQIARHIGLNRPVAYNLASLAALAAILGHVFPVWLRFRGGKGVATALGVFLVLSPATVACALLAFAAVFALTRFVSLASIAGALTLTLAAWFFVAARTPFTVAAFLGIPVLVIAKHHANIRRLLAGTESRFSTRKAAA